MLRCEAGRVAAVAAPQIWGCCTHHAFRPTPAGQPTRSASSRECSQGAHTPRNHPFAALLQGGRCLWKPARRGPGAPAFGRDGVRPASGPRLLRGVPLLRRFLAPGTARALPACAPCAPAAACPAPVRDASPRVRTGPGPRLLRGGSPLRRCGTLRVCQPLALAVERQRACCPGSCWRAEQPLARLRTVPAACWMSGRGSQLCAPPAARAPPAVLSLSEPAAAARPNLRWSVPVGGHERRGERRAYQPHGPHPCARLPSAAVQAGCSQKRAVARVQDDDIESESRSESKSESRSESKGVEEEVEDEVCASAKPALTPCPLSAAALCCTPAPMLRPVLSARKRPGPLTRGASHLPTVVPGHKPGAIASQEAKAGQPARPPAHAHAVGRRRRRVVLPQPFPALGVRSPALPVPPSCSRIPSVDTVAPGFNPSQRGVYASIVRALMCCAALPHQALAASAAAKTAVLIPVPLTAASTFWRMRMARTCSPCLSAD